MSSRWRYYNTKRGGNFPRGRGKRGGRGTSLTAISLPREDYLHNGKNNEYYRDKPMDPNGFRDETVLSVSFSQNMLGAACYEQSSQIVRIMNDISEDHEFEYLKRLIEEVQPTMILVNKSQDLSFIKFLSSKYEPRERSIDEDTTADTTESSIPKWDGSMSYSADKTTIDEEKEDDEEVSSEPTAKLYKLPNNFFKMLKALERLKQMAGSSDDSMTDEEKYMLVAMRFDIEAVNMMRSFGALLLFLDETRMGVESEPLTVSPPIKSIKTMTLPNLVEIDFNTIQALGILPKETDRKKVSGQQKSLYSLVDICRSTVGKKCLRMWFRNPTSDRDELLSRQKCVNFFKQDWNAEVTAKIASMVGKVKPLNNIFSRFQSGTAQLIHWEGFMSTVNAIVEIVNIIRQTTISTCLPVEGDLLREVSEVAVITGSIINFADSRLQGRMTIMPGINEELDEIRNTYENMPMTLTAVARQEAARLGILNVNDVSCVYVPLVGFILSLPTNFPFSSQPDMSLVYATSDELRVKNTTTERLEEEFGDVLLKLIDSQTEIILSLKTRLMKKKRSVNTLLSLVGRIDALVAFGIVAAENGWNCPELIDEPVIEAAELFHPISALVVKKKYVPNPVSSGLKSVKVSIITGPNACGKSAYMKSIGILAYLAHVGSFVPARHARIGKVDRIVTRMFTVDSVLDGMSTFAKDVEQVALALRKATANSLVIIDEFGKGTMTEVGLSLLASCLSHWMKKGSDRCPHVFLASHFHALPRYIPLETNVATFLTFTVVREPGGKVKYLFQLTPGMVDCSFAMAVAKEEGIPMNVIGRACRIYKALKSGTPLKDVRAEITNKDEDLLIADMDSVLENAETFIDDVESFAKRDHAEREEEDKQTQQTTSEGPSRAQSRENTEKEKRSNEAIVKTKGTPTNRPRPSSTALSAKSLASMDRMAIFDALLPLRKEKQTVETPKEQNSSERVVSPDPFTTDGEDKEDEENGESQATPNKLVPLMQRLSSGERRGEIRAESRVNEVVLGKKKPEERSGIKRPHSSSFREQAGYSKKKERTLELEEDSSKKPSHYSVFGSSVQKVCSNDTLFTTPLITNQRDPTDQLDDSMFKTPTNIKRNPKLRLFRDDSSRTVSSRDTEVIGREDSQMDSLFATPQFGNRQSKDTKSLLRSPILDDPNGTRRSSSRRSMRSEDSQQFKICDFEEDGSNLFSQLGSQFSIFHTQQSTSDITTKGVSSDMIEQPRSTENKESGSLVITEQPSRLINKSVVDEVETFLFQTSKKKVSEKQKLFLLRKTQVSRQSLSPSSVILGDLTRETQDRTPLPRGDKPEDHDFEFNPTDDDPIYGQQGPTNTTILDFLKSDDDDEEFLKSFMDTEKSLKIDTSADRSSSGK